MRKIDFYLPALARFTRDLSRVRSFQFLPVNVGLKMKLASWGILEEILAFV